jgi:DNA replication protein DnaC
MNIKQIIDQSRSELTDVREKFIARRKMLTGIVWPEFAELISIECQKILITKGEDTKFFIDGETERILIILYQYSTRDDSFKGNLNKGIMLAGGFGVGKTLIMSAFSELFFKLTSQRIQVYNSVKLSDAIRKNGFDDYVSKPIIIDELGREQLSVKNYGNEVYPIIELLSLRCENGSWTFATTNYKFSTLTENYGEYTAERLIEMFNFIEFNGKSKRK